jgi:hypothetical protein
MIFLIVLFGIEVFLYLKYPSPLVGAMLAICGLLALHSILRELR